MISLTPPPAPTAIYSRATDRSRGEMGMRLGESVAVALPKSANEERISDIVQRIFAALQIVEQDDAVRTSPEAVWRTLQILVALPGSIPLPDVVVESESEIGLDWDLGSRRVVSLTVRDNPMVGFAAFLGDEPIYGRAPFVGEVPQTLRYLLGRLFPRSIAS